MIGLMSGTSADGVDAALVEVEGSGLEAKAKLIAFECFPFKTKVIDALFRAFTNEDTRPSDLSALNFIMGELFAAAAIKLCECAGVGLSEIDLIGSHGQTVWHGPEPLEIGGMWSVSTLQIGEPAVIAERTGVTVVADFRPADVAAGGEGAPLVSYADYLLFRSPNRGRAVQNIGGTANVTYIPGGGKLDQIVAFDTGPGNMLIDAVVFRLTDAKLRYDAGGALALAGTPDRVALGNLMRHPFLQKRPPKSTGREDFGVRFAEQILAENSHLSTEDMVATVTAFTAQSIRIGYERWLPKMPDDIVIGGGGARNPALMQMLAEAMPRAKLYTHEDFGINSDAKEALAFALLASQAIRGEPANVPSATGAERRAILGKIVPGRNYRTLMAKVGFGNENRH